MNKKIYDMEAIEKSACNSAKPIWMRESVILGLTGGLTLLDGVTLYTVFDNLMYEDPFMCLIVTLGTALALNFTPLIGGRLVHEYRYGFKGVKKWLLFSIAFTFLLLFAATFWLRWTTRELMFEAGGGITSVGRAIGVSAETDSSSFKAISLTVLLGIMPGITSMINLALGYLSGDPVYLKISYLKQEQVRLQSEINNHMAAKNELERDWLTLLQDTDKEHLDAALMEVHSFRDRLCHTARYLLAEKIANPEAITELLGSIATDIENVK